MGRPLLLDLFCGAGGAAMGYHRAGFDVIGVDIRPQPRYPFEFHQADVFQYLSEFPWNWAAIHASPPCQDHIRGGSHPEHGTAWMLAAVREQLCLSGLPWVIENVPGAPMRADYRLCGCMFSLPHLRRERWFETSWRGFDLRSPCQHVGHTVSVVGTSAWKGRGPKISVADWRESMGIDWMGIVELCQAIPPAYTEYVGRQLLDALSREAGHG